MQLQHHLLQLMIIFFISTIAAGGGTEGASTTGGWKIRNSAGRTGAHHFTRTCFRKRQQRDVYLLHCLLVVARRAGRRAGIHADLVTRLLAHAGPHAQNYSFTWPQLVQNSPPLSIMLLTPFKEHAGIANCSLMWARAGKNQKKLF